MFCLFSRVFCAESRVGFGAQIVGEESIRLDVVDDFLQLVDDGIGVFDVPQHLCLSLAGNVDVAHVQKFVGKPHAQADVGDVRIIDVVDIVQIPAFLCRQTDLLKAAAETGKVINVKKGQFLSPKETHSIVEKLDTFGNPNVILCDRGTSFGYNTLINDMTCYPIMAETGCPVCCDATHSVQRPGAGNGCTIGNRDMAEVIARAAVAVGVACVFMEVHQDPDNAPSDGPNMIKLSDFERIVSILLKIDKVTKDYLYNK